MNVPLFQEVARIRDGASFGELALLKDGPRAASIVTSTDCKFAILNKKDYLWTIGQEEKRRLKKIVEFFRKFRLFQPLRGHIIEKVFQNMKLVHFIRG